MGRAQRGEVARIVHAALSDRNDVMVMHKAALIAAAAVFPDIGAPALIP